MPPSTAHVPVVVILILRVELARVRSIVVLSVVTPVNQPDTAPGVVLVQPSPASPAQPSPAQPSPVVPWSRLRQENICHTATP